MQDTTPIPYDWSEFSEWTLKTDPKTFVRRLGTEYREASGIATLQDIPKTYSETTNTIKDNLVIIDTTTCFSKA